MAKRWILHVDLDQFVVAVEVRRRPELRGRPVVVGGNGNPNQARMVAASASYEARVFGVRSGMPLRTAARKCPDAVFLPSDPTAYDEASAEVMDTLRRFPVVVEVWGWDEAFLGAETDDPEALAADLRQAVLDETGLTCCIGIGDNKLRAKIATGFAKPVKTATGFTEPLRVYRLTAENWMEVMGHRPTEALWGIGPKTARKLAELGLHTVADLAAANVEELQARFGPTIGVWHSRVGRGLGDTKVTDEPWIARSRSHQVTYPKDLVDRAEIESEVLKLAREVTREVVAQGRWIERVAVTVRYRSFFTPTRISKLPAATQDVADVERTALTLLAKFDLGRPVRLLGVRVELVNDT
jgi:DNA polymerase IV